MSLPTNFFIGRGGISGETLQQLNFSEVSSGVWRRTEAGEGLLAITGSYTVHVIGAGGWSGVDGMGYGNCGGGGGGGGAKASFTNLNGNFAFQVGAGVGGYVYTSGEDGSLERDFVVSNYSPGPAQRTWFNSESTLYGEGGKPGWYGPQSRSTVDGNGNPSGDGGVSGHSLSGIGTLIGASSGGYGGGSNWNAQGNDDSYSPTSSSYGGGGGGRGNSTYGGYGASGAMGGSGGRGGVPNGSNSPRQNAAGTFGGGNGGQAKWQSSDTVGPFTTINSCNGVIEIDFN